MLNLSGMWKRYANILVVFISCVLLLGHQFTPHKHQKAKEEYSFKSDPPEKDFSNIFSLDLGPDHLKNYQLNTLFTGCGPGEYGFPILSGFTTFFNLPGLSLPSNSIVLWQYSNNFTYKALRLPALSRRGPPFTR